MDPPAVQSIDVSSTKKSVDEKCFDNSCTVCLDATVGCFVGLCGIKFQLLPLLSVVSRKNPSPNRTPLYIGVPVELLYDENFGSMKKKLGYPAVDLEFCITTFSSFLYLLSSNKVSRFDFIPSKM
ncbi:hypothetical protein HN51_005661 [Arachis hypogaea]